MTYLKEDVGEGHVRAFVDGVAFADHCCPAFIVFRFALVVKKHCVFVTFNCVFYVAIEFGFFQLSGSLEYMFFVVVVVVVCGSLR